MSVCCNNKNGTFSTQESVQKENGTFSTQESAQKENGYRYLFHVQETWNPYSPCGYILAKIVSAALALFKRCAPSKTKNERYFKFKVQVKVTTKEPLSLACQQMIVNKLILKTLNDELNDGTDRGKRGQ